MCENSSAARVCWVQINYNSVRVFMVMKEPRVTTRLTGVFESFWTTIELYGADGKDVSGFGYTDNTCCFWSVMGFTAEGK